MKIFLDTAELREIEKAEKWGVVDGVTTNPSLIKKAVKARDKIDMEEYIKKICKSVEGPVSLEVIGLTADEMIEEAMFLYNKFNPVNNNVVIKIPVNPKWKENPDGQYEGLKALKELSGKEVKTNTTLVMKPEQALLAAKAGTDYVSPFAGRIDDFIRSKAGLTRGEDYKKWDYNDPDLWETAKEREIKPLMDNLTGEEVKETYQNEEIRGICNQLHDNGIVSGVDLLRSIIDIFGNYDFDTEVLAASMRNSRQVREVAELGTDVATLPFRVIEEMIDHPKTNEGIEAFTKDVVPEYQSLFDQ